MPCVGRSGAFPSSAAMVVTVFCSLPEHKPLFPVEPRHSGYRQKALVSSKIESSCLEQDDSCLVLR
jgi:hypothetical protein